MQYSKFRATSSFFTFRQLMVQTGVNSLADAGFRCNVCIVEDDGSLLIYVLYDG